MQDEREDTTPTSSLYLRALLACVENLSWSISLTRNIARSVHVQTRYLWHIKNPFRRGFNLQKADWDGYSTELDKLIEDVDPIPEKNMVGSWTRYVWLLEGVFQEYVEQATYPVYQKKNQRACMKSIRNNMRATILITEPQRLLTHLWITWKKRRRRDGRRSLHQPTWPITVVKCGRLSKD